MIGNRLKQARLLAGMTQAELAKATANYGYELTSAAISKYERHKSTPPADFLLVAAQALDVPTTYFLHEPTLNVEWLAFRRHSALPKKKQASVKSYAEDIAELQIELQQLLYPNSEPNLPARRTVTTFAEAEDAAMRLRDAWGLDSHPVDNLVQTAEDRQVVVINWQQDAGKFDGLSGWCAGRPVTVMGTVTSVDRQRFSLAHEIGHLLMDTADVDSKREEKLANRFAGAFLVPAERARYELGERRTQLDLDELKVLKRKYGLSMAAWIYRAKDLGIITDNHAATLYTEISERGWRVQEPVDYISDETPLQLQQMIRRALAEGLISPDRIERVDATLLDDDIVDTDTSDHLTVYDLLAMPQAEREALMEDAFALAANDEFEIFEAFGDADFNDEAF